MASMRDIKRRKNSITSTQQITKAMKLVSTVRLQKSRLVAEESKPYFETLHHTMVSILKKAGPIKHPFLETERSGKTAVVLITSNRGLAGGYNSNMVRLITSQDWNREDVLIYTIGTKGRDTISHKGYEILKDRSEIINQPLYSDAMEVCSELMDEYWAGHIGRIYIAYTYFRNTVSHVPTLMQILPVSENDFADEEDDNVLMEFEPSAEEALENIVPKYISSIIYGALLEAQASENGARMQAMDSATSNAQEMIDTLSLQYNRARQGSITQELTEIIAGAEAL